MSQVEIVRFTLGVQRDFATDCKIHHQEDYTLSIEQVQPTEVSLHRTEEQALSIRKSAEFTLVEL